MEKKIERLIKRVEKATTRFEEVVEMGRQRQRQFDKQYKEAQKTEKKKAEVVNDMCKLVKHWIKQTDDYIKGRD